MMPIIAPRKLLRLTRSCWASRAYWSIFSRSSFSFRRSSICFRCSSVSATPFSARRSSSSSFCFSCSRRWVATVFSAETARALRLIFPALASSAIRPTTGTNCKPISRPIFPLPHSLRSLRISAIGANTVIIHPIIIGIIGQPAEGLSPVTFCGSDTSRMPPMSST